MRYKREMAFVRTLARPMLAAIFVSGGIDAWRDPGPRAEKGKPVADLVTRAIPQAPKDAETLVRINSAVHVGAGLLFALGRFPRLSPLVLAASMVPTTAGGHRFWEEEDPGQRAGQQIHFLKNVGLCGGLIFAATAGPGGRRKAAAAAKQSRKGRRG